MKSLHAALCLTILLSAPVASQAQAYHRNCGTQDTAATDSGKQAVNLLSDAQKQALRNIQARSEQSAKPFALHMAQVTKRIYANMLADKPNDTLRKQLGTEIDSVVVELLHVKGDSIRDVIGILTPAQRNLIRQEMAKPDAPADLTETIERTFHLRDKL